MQKSRNDNQNKEEMDLKINNFNKILTQSRKSELNVSQPTSLRAKSVMSRHEKDKKLGQFIAAKVQDISFRKYEQVKETA